MAYVVLPASLNSMCARPVPLVILAPSLWPTKSRLQRIATKSWHVVATVQAELRFAVRLMAGARAYFRPKGSPLSWTRYWSKRLDFKIRRERSLPKPKEPVYFDD